MTLTSVDDYYSDLDESLSSFTNPDKILQPETVDDFIEFIKIGSVIKENLVKQTRYETSAFMLTALKAIINEQVEAKLLSQSQGDTICEFVESLAIEKGYAAW